MPAFTRARRGERRRRRIISPDEEEALLTELRKCRNKEMPLIFAVAISTGMRRAEILGLLWSQIDIERGVINLDADQTKADEERLVILLPEAVAAFKVIPRVDDRVFHYKIEGFKTVFRRVLERAKLDGIHMHDTRRSFISRVLKDITSSPVAIADMIGSRSVVNLQKRTIERIRQGNIYDRRWLHSNRGGAAISRWAQGWANDGALREHGAGEEGLRRKIGSLADGVTSMMPSALIYPGILRCQS